MGAATLRKPNRKCSLPTPRTLQTLHYRNRWRLNSCAAKLSTCPTHHHRSLVSLQTCSRPTIEVTAESPSGTSPSDGLYISAASSSTPLAMMEIVDKRQQSTSIAKCTHHCFPLDRSMPERSSPLMPTSEKNCFSRALNSASSTIPTFP